MHLVLALSKKSHVFWHPLATPYIREQSKEQRHWEALKSPFCHARVGKGAGESGLTSEIMDEAKYRYFMMSVPPSPA